MVDSNGNLITVCPSSGGGGGSGGSGGGGGGAPGAPGAPGASRSCTSVARPDAYGALPQERADWAPFHADQVHSCKAQMEAWVTASTLLPALLLGGSFQIYLCSAVFDICLYCVALVRPALKLLPRTFRPISLDFPHTDELKRRHPPQAP